MKNIRIINILAVIFLIFSCDTSKKISSASTATELSKEDSLEQNTVYFDFDKHNLTFAEQRKLDKIVVNLKENQEKITVEGHCDERGSLVYNKKLGFNRAQSVKNYLVKNGISAKRIGVVSFGKTKPVAFGKSEDSHSKNRRAVVIKL